MPAKDIPEKVEKDTPKPSTSSKKPLVKSLDDTPMDHKPTPTTTIKAQPVDSKTSKTNKQEPNLPTSSKAKNKKRFHIPKWLKWTLIILGSLILILGIAGGILAYLTVPPAKEAKAAADQLSLHGQELLATAKDKNLAGMKGKLAEVKTDLGNLEASVNKLRWASNLPYAKDYFSDADNAIAGGYSLIKAGELSFDAVTPYADLLGLSTGEGDTEDPETTEDRIQFVVTTLNSITPQMDEIGAQLKEADSYISQINPDRYPEEYDGRKIRDQIITAQNSLKQASILLNDAKPIIEAAPYMLGIEEPRTYLVLFQNDAELRPTGGFLTAYALLEVGVKGENFSITPIASSDIYDLDNRYNGKLEAPDALIEFIEDPYAKEQRAGQNPRWRLRDMNLSPDFKESMETFYEAYQQTGSRQVDGIIGVDTKFFVALLDVIGPVGVSGYGNFSSEEVAECNCPQAVYELESAISYETPYIRENRKAILGPVMHSVLANAMGQPKEKMADLVEAVIQAIKQKNIIMYYTDEEVQAAVESFNLAGRIRPASGDYFMLVDTNLGGRKSHLYIEQDIKLEVQTSDNSTQNKLTVRYKNPQKYDGWLNGESPNWVRVYAPAGSKLVDSTGSELEIKTYEENDKTVFEGFFVIRPGGALNTFTLTYETPVESSNQYNLLIQKQGGTKNHEFELVVNEKGQTFDLDGDKDVSIPL